MDYPSVEAIMDYPSVEAIMDYPSVEAIMDYPSVEAIMDRNLYIYFACLGDCLFVFKILPLTKFDF